MYSHSGFTSLFTAWGQITLACSMWHSVLQFVVPVKTGFLFHIIIVRTVCCPSECFHLECLRNSACVQFTCCFDSHVLKCASDSIVPCMYRDINVDGALHASADACNCCCQMFFWLLEVRHFLEMYFCTFFFSLKTWMALRKTYLLCFWSFMLTLQY